MKANEILQSLLDYEGKRLMDFSEEIGLSGTRLQAMRDLLNGKTRRMSQRVVDTILRAKPYYSRRYLMEGRGPMLAKDAEDAVVEPEAPLEREDAAAIMRHVRGVEETLRVSVARIAEQSERTADLLEEVRDTNRRLAMLLEGFYATLPVGGHKGGEEGKKGAV